MKKSYLLISTIVSMLLTSCSINALTPSKEQSKEEESSQKSEEVIERSYIEFKTGDNVDLIASANDPLKPNTIKSNCFDIMGNIGASSFDHTTGTIYYQDYAASNAENVLASKNYLEGNTTSYDFYSFIEIDITINGNDDVYFDAGLSTGVIKEGQQAAKGLRVCFLLDDGPFIYAPFQDKEKCSYSINTSLDGTGVREYGEELIDQNSAERKLLPNNKLLPIIIWIDGNDENVVNNVGLEAFGVSLSINK